MYRILIILLLLQFVPDGGSKQGRRGNALYEEKKYDEAAEQYRSGLTALSGEEPGHTLYGLTNNLGAALHQSGDFENASKSFLDAMSTARSEADFARAAYNAGNNAYAMQDLQSALDMYRKALLADPDNEDAKYNYEFVKRQLQEQEQQQQQQGGDRSDENQQNNEQQNQSGQNPQDQQNEPQQNGDEQNQDEQQQDQPQQSPEESDSGDEQQQNTPRPDQLTREEAERILQALENDEEDLLRENRRLKSRPRSVEKDW